MNIKLPCTGFLISICLILGNSCTVSKPAVSPLGAHSNIEYQSEDYKGELIAIYNDSLILMDQGGLYKICLDDIGKLAVKYKNTGRSFALIPLSLTYAFIGAAIIPSSPLLGSVLVLGTIGATAALFTHNPYKFTAPLNNVLIKEQIRVHCRYPEGVSPDQLQRLLDHHGQTHFLQYQ